MRFYKNLLVFSLGMMSFSGNGQTPKNSKTMNEQTKNNPLLCDAETGVCGLPEVGNNDNISIETKEKSVKVIYFTDPICSSCWGIEPQLRKMKLEYGKEIDVEYHMGGLLPDWSYNSGGISKPSDVAHHWDEVSGYYDMPIDGDVWLEDPLDSSYPPSIAFKAAQLQSNEKAILFMRELREFVFLKKKNIARWENIALAAKKVNLDVNQLKSDYEGKAKTLFENDLKLARELGVRGFPTLFFVNPRGETQTVYGTKPYPFYETAILTVNPKATKAEFAKDWESLFKKYNSLTAKEFAELSGKNRKESERILDELSSQKKLEKFTTKNGSMWTLIN
ncbi:Predicted dithiol-disulfide isomerase, DsbA family [Epilithonimonas zeae]|uniref:Predicted dithiol-disulfide isomerase, DsbA family n=2 Tax=Epilithonimonas zeae TaxID=1416779 RepID=A0A1N6GDI4_9FLAO|nr:Predicted dithiol-disulfide isomerase, DsbA family [Epilithonimonas zeae]